MRRPHSHGPLNRCRRRVVVRIEYPRAVPRAREQRSSYFFDEKNITDPLVFIIFFFLFFYNIILFDIRHTTMTGDCRRRVGNGSSITIVELQK